MPAARLRRLTAARFRAVTDINVLPPAAVRKTSLRAHRHSRGTVVSIASIAAFWPTSPSTEWINPKKLPSSCVSSSATKPRTAPKQRTNKTMQARIC